MNAIAESTGSHPSDYQRYQRCIDVSKRVRWEIDRDVIRGRAFDFQKTFLPDGLSRISSLPFIQGEDALFLSQIQGRTYANVFGLVERFINAKILEVSRDHWLGDQVKLEALIRFSDEELKHQALFRRLDEMMSSDMPDGYNFLPQPDEVASVVLTKCTWSVLALTCLIELFTQAHYLESIKPDERLSDLYKDVFLFHWKEESQHAILDELEWRREDARLSEIEREQAVDDLIALVAAVDGILQVQSKADADYFTHYCRTQMNPERMSILRSGLLCAYRWQYIFSGVEIQRFRELLGSLVTSRQMERIGAALATLC
jgi:hypothetical protein